MIPDNERHIKILDYILKKSLDEDPKITKSDIMRYLKDSRPMTTHKIIIELIKEGKIKMIKPKDKPYSQIDYLIINEKDEFIKIYNILSDIEGIMNMIKKITKKDDSYKLLKTMLEFLLVQTKPLQTQKDRDIIYTKIIELFIRLPYDVGAMKEELDSYMSHRYELPQAKIVSSLEPLVNKFRKEFL